MSRCCYLIYVRLFTHVYIPSSFAAQIKSKAAELAVKRIFSQHARITYFQTNPVWIQNNEISQGMD